MLGAKNPRGLYVPMSPTEMETLARLWETRSYQLRDARFGFLPIVDVIVGDKRLGLIFEVGPKCFEGLEVPVPVYTLDLTLRALNRTLFTKTMMVSNEGQPLMVCKGVHFGLQLDIAIDTINPELVREVIPHVNGLTTRLGNTKYTPHEAKLIQSIEKGNSLVRELDRQNLQKVKTRET